jgi:hypothetical protein
VTCYLPVTGLLLQQRWMCCALHNFRSTEVIVLLAILMCGSLRINLVKH